MKLMKLIEWITVAPRTEIVRQWRRIPFVTIYMSRLRADIDIQNYGVDLCANDLISNLQDGFQKVCNDSNTLVICDEHHHAAVKALGEMELIAPLQMQNMYLSLRVLLCDQMEMKQFG